VVTDHAGARVSVFFQDGGGSFGLRTDHVLPGSNAHAVLADFDADARLDVAIAGWVVSGPSVLLGRTAATHTFRKVTSNRSIALSFGANSYTIAATAGANGSISPSGNVSVTHGDDAMFTITPDGGYVVADVLVDNVSVGAVTTYTFDDVTAPHTIAASFGPPTDVAGPPVTRTGLEAPAPNPFNPTTQIRYSLLETGPVRLAIYDARGRLVRQLVEGDRPGPQWHVAIWNGRNAAGIPSPAGVYFVKLDASRVAMSRRIVLVK